MANDNEAYSFSVAVPIPARKSNRFLEGDVRGMVVDLFKLKDRHADNDFDLEKQNSKISDVKNWIVCLPAPVPCLVL